MKINIVNYEEGRFNGILSKYAYKMQEELKKLGHKVTVSPKPRKADINHHINYRSYIPSGGKDTLMVTHIWEGDKLEKLKEAMQTAKVGICFSEDQKRWLEEKGLENLDYILPAHDQYPRRLRKILIPTNVYPDGCKREQMFYELLKHIDKTQYHFFIIGYGWNIEGLNCNISYLDHFNADDYRVVLNECEYALYFGKDEGSMGILDAKNVGMKVIAPEIGFHKDIEIDYPFDTQEELHKIFDKFEYNPVAHLTWENYAKEHEKIWKEL